MKEIQLEVVVAICCFIIRLGCPAKLFDPRLSWTNFEYQRRTEKREYVANDAVPYDVDAYHLGGNLTRVFLTFPRYSFNEPATLVAFLNDGKPQKNPIATPYPSWDWHDSIANCRKPRIVSTYKIRVDNCHRLWVLDSGRVSGNQVCPPQILSFNLRRNNSVFSKEIPFDQLKHKSMLMDMEVELIDCRKHFVYIADSTENRLLIYGVENNTFRSFNDATFKPNVNMKFNINGEAFKIRAGVNALALVPVKYLYKDHQNNTRLYYHALSSLYEYSVSVWMLQKRDFPPYLVRLNLNKTTAAGPMAASAMGAMIFASIGDSALKCWPLTGGNVETMVRNETTLQMVTGLKVVKNSSGAEELWILSSHINKFLNKQMSKSRDIYFRIFVIPVDYALNGTNCKSEPVISIFDLK